MNTQLCSKIEAIVFAAGEPVGIQNLSKFLNCSLKECQRSVDDLANEYQQRGAGLQIIQNRNTIQLVSNSKHGELVAKFLKKNLNEPLSNAAMEVLSVIAYRGPMTRAQIEHIRGVNCSFTLRNLAIRGLVERKDNPADNRSYLYEASNDFIKSLGLEKLSELPEYETMHNDRIAEQSSPKDNKEVEE